MNMESCKKIVVWGTGDVSAAFLYRNRSKYEIEYFLCNYKSGDFHGISIKKPCKENCENKFIVIASTYYEEISGQLKGWGFKELVNFIPSEALNKKVVLLHGNCHMTSIKLLMETSEDFVKNYYIYDLPRIQEIRKGYIDEDLLHYCDVFIHQDIREDNSYGYKLSDEYMIKRLGRDAKRICVPNLFGLGRGFFPQTVLWNENNPVFRKNKNGLFPHGDENIMKLMNAEWNIEDIIKRLKGGGVYTGEYILECFNLYLDKIKEREQKWDVKILSYILEKYRKEKLFYDLGHPCNNVMKEICKGIFRILGIDSLTIGNISQNMDAYEQPIYPCVARALNLDYEYRFIRCSGIKLDSGEMDFEEYIRQYIYWCYG